MQLIENSETEVNLITSVNTELIKINNEELSQSCIVDNNELFIDIDIKSIDQLNASHIDYLIASNPELVIIGSGNDHVFPDVSILTPIAKKGIGFEVMNNKSAARTYNVLIAEERKVSCLLIIGS